MKLFLTEIYLLFNVVNYSFAIVQARYDTACGYLSQKIYCSGGMITVYGDSILDSTINYLSIVNYDGVLGTKWTAITNTMDRLNIEPRELAQSAVLEDGKTMLLSGGLRFYPIKLASQTIGYNTETNSWVKYPDYVESTYGSRQIHWASSVYVPGYGIGFYGGIETHADINWTYNGKNMSQFYDSRTKLRSIGYTSLTFFDIRKSADPWYTFPTQNNLPQDFSRSQTSIFDSKSNRIFFFGGSFIDAITNTRYYHPPGISVTFNIITGTWGKQGLEGDLPGPRFYHTTTLLESTNRHVLLYGGSNSDSSSRASSGYCYVLNLDTYEWVNHNIAAPKGTDLFRARHSAVSVNKTTVFILFGKNEEDMPISSFIPLNVTNPSNISYLETYIDPYTVPPKKSSSNDGSDNNSGLTVGATAGIAVGSVLAALIIFSTLFCLWKRNNNKKKKIEVTELEKPNEVIETTVMEVNWDEIDRNDGKLPIKPTGNYRYSSTLADDSIVVANNKYEIYSPSAMLIKPDIQLQRTNAVEDYIMSPPLLMKLQKPDGGL